MHPPLSPAPLFISAFSLLLQHPIPPPPLSLSLSLSLCLRHSSPYIFLSLSQSFYRAQQASAGVPATLKKEHFFRERFLDLPSLQKRKRTVEGGRIGEEDDEMPAYPLRDVHRPPSAAWVVATAVWLLCLAAHTSRSGALRPSNHGLAFQKNATRAPAAMVSFFGGAGGGAALPQAGNATAGAVWDVPSQSSPSDGDATEEDMVDGRDRARTVLLTAGVVCGAVVVALLAAAALAYLVQARRRRDECGGGGNG